jgi:hypothetical protein
MLQDDPIRTLQRILETFFPELSGHGNRFIVYWSDPYEQPFSSRQLRQVFGFNVVEPGKDLLSGDTPETLGQGLLNAYCQFRSAGEVESIAFHGRAVQEQENAAFHALSYEHLEWSDARLVEALTEAGAKYGPAAKNAFLEHIPPKDRLEALVQGQIELLSADFEGRAPNATKQAFFTWEVNMRVASRQLPSEVVRFALYFEPFGGALVHIGRVH